MKPSPVIPEAIQQQRQAAANQLEKLTGWPWHPRELGGFFARPQSLSATHRTWRDQLVERLADGSPDSIKTSSNDEGPGSDKNFLKAAVDETVERLREMARILGVLHGSPDLGNKSDPVDELIYILLSRKTREAAYIEAYERLKARFGCWDDLLAAPESEVFELVQSAGLGETRVRSLYAALQTLRDTFGHCTLEPLKRMSVTEAENFLCSIPDVQLKSAYCVMLFALGFSVFPVDTHVGRILSRIQPFDPIGVDLTGMDHRKLQDVIRYLIPPELMRSLHVNLIEHGRKICLAKQPRCESCELSRFCFSHRREVSRLADAKQVPTVVDLFCGAGGMSAGFARAGLRTLAAVDSNASSTRTFSLNHAEVEPQNVLTADITDPEVLNKLKDLAPSPDVLIGGPPCQGFSSAGNRSKLAMRSRREQAGIWEEDDSRNYLFEYLVEIAAELKPKVVVMENVPGMDARRKGGGKSFMEQAQSLLEIVGYTCAIWELDAAAYGVPQNRIRKFLIGSLAGVAPHPPIPQYHSRVRDLDRFPDLLPSLSVNDAIADLPALAAHDGDEVVKAEYTIPVEDRRLRHFVTNAAFPIRNNPTIIYNHRSRFNNDDDLELFSTLRPGENSLDLIKHHGRGDLMKYRRDIFHDKYARMRPDRPSKTIVSHLSRDGNSYIHPLQVRTITPREGARLQSFADSYIFCGSTSDQWQQIGNAVPPRLAMEIALVVKEHLRQCFAS